VVSSFISDTHKNRCSTRCRVVSSFITLHLVLHLFYFVSDINDETTLHLVLHLFYFVSGINDETTLHLVLHLFLCVSDINDDTTLHLVVEWSSHLYLSDTHKNICNTRCRVVSSFIPDIKKK
jgi:hypothetical protein